jgi:hypothetical protein
MSRKWRRQAPIGETLALSGHNDHPVSQTLAPLGLLQPAMCANPAQHTNPSRSMSHLQGADPHRSNLCQNALMRASFFFFVQGLVTTMSCLCHPSNHLMGSSAPWRSELIISPCAPDPLVPVRRAWSCTSKTTPSMGSLVLDIIAM